MKIISVCNIKGGVGKSTTSSILGAGLTAKGYRVLMVDSDPQSNLTMCFLPEQAEDTPSLYHVFTGEKTIDEAKQSIKIGLDLVIGDFSLCNADMEFVKAGRLKLLHKALKNMKSKYDFVIVDTSPSLGVLSLNALIVSDYLIVPMGADNFSLKGIKLLKQTIDEVEEERERPIDVAGLLLTKYQSNTNVSKLLDNSIQSAAELLNTKVFSSRIRQATVLKESQIAKIDLLEYAPRAQVTADYQAFIDELLERMEK